MLPNSSTSSFLQSRLGLAQASGSPRVRTERKTNAARQAPLWQTVTITREHATSPALTCNTAGLEMEYGIQAFRDLRWNT